MYYEEKLINGVMHWRGDPDAEFTPYSLEELSVRYESTVRHLNSLYAKLNEGV